jgi:hypothetical protein
MSRRIATREGETVMNRSHISLTAIATLTLLGVATLPHRSPAQTVAPAYAGQYTIIFNANLPGVTTPYGGINFLPTDPNTLVLGGSANNAAAQVFSLPVIRGAGNHITGFGAATVFTNANGTGGGIDGGLVFEPGSGVELYTSFADNTLGEVKPSSFVPNGGTGVPDKLVSLTGLGVSSSVGTLQYVPAGFGAASGKLKIASYSGGDWHDMTLTPDGSGTFNVAVGPTTFTNVGAQNEGIVYVRAGNPDFGSNSTLVSEYGAGRVSAYQVDANADPLGGSRQDFITGLSGAEGGIIDPLTGDFVFSTFGGGNKVVIISGFTAPITNATPEPGALALLVSVGLAGISCVRRRRR